MKIRSLNDVTEFPLCWPEGKPRAAKRKYSPFGTTMAKAQAEIRDEMQRWDARGHAVSMAPQHRQGAIDPGVALWWNMRPRAPSQPFELRVIACDTYDDRESNLHAIALTLERLRSMERYGTYSLWQAIEGARAALPPPPRPDGPPWWEVLGVERDWPLAAIEQVARVRMREHHPDTGGTAEAFTRFTAALAEARKDKA